MNISRELKVSLPVARLLVQRGNQNAAQARKFLYPQLSTLEDPLKMKGMQAALERIGEAITAKEKIVVYGDYDADGVCSIVILLECFARLGYPVGYYVPNRFSEGYGLNAEALHNLHAQGCKLVITVDCGITSMNEAELARKLDMDLIITDHHTPADQQPIANAIINPKNDQLPTITNLAGVGVSYKLACALLHARGMEPGQDWLDLVAIATVADIVPLLEENRTLVKYGLKALDKTTRPGLVALLEKTGMLGKPVNSWQIGFVLAPRLNSAGRIDSARKSIALLLSRDESEAQQLAEELCRLNDERREIEENIYQQALLNLPDLEQEKFILVSGENWHEGVIGIVASRLANKFNRPAIVLSWEGEQGKGSARSSGDFDLYAALLHCRVYLERFGGHRMAAGLALHRDQLDHFRKALQDYMLGQELPTIGKKIYPADLEIDEAELSLNLWSEIELLAPFGEGNPVPSLVLRSSLLHDMLLVGTNGAHFKFRTGTSSLEAIAFNGADMMHPGLKVCKQDLLFDLAENNFKGRNSLQLKIRDIKPVWRDDWQVRETSSAVQIKQVLTTTVKELIKGHPVLFVYPTVRSLMKHREMMQAIVKPDLLQEMHGLLDRKTRDSALRKFSNGETKIYLSTQSFLEYLAGPRNSASNSVAMPPNLNTVVSFWPESGQTTSFWNSQNLNIFNLTISPQLHLQASQAGDTDPGRSIIYVNRPATVKKILQQYPQAEVEAGAADPALRRTSRQHFRNSNQGLLLVDGTHPPGPVQLGEIDALTLLDSPFAAYELAAVADYVDNLELPLQLAFTAEDINRNRIYLQRIYPEPAKLELVWRSLLGFGRKTLRLEETEILARLGKEISDEVSRLELMASLQIMSDLDLCQFQKSGSIMAIYFLSTQKDAIQPEFSPYFHEGKKEKELLERWRSIAGQSTGMVM
ncbi:MAG: Single-stranded DNA-specific exonuclease-like protein [Firmicutes bacterium]|nr:Single-stranded DNA-specific exonuclease-like protein [Bacillota bacterium]